MMKKIRNTGILLIAILFLTTPSVMGATITQTLLFGPATPSFTETLTFNKYSGPEIVTSVWVEFIMNITGGSLGVDNDGAEQATVNVLLGAEGNISSLIPLLDGSFIPIGTNVLVTTGDTFTLAPDNGDGAIIDTSAPDGAVHLGGSIGAFDNGYVNPFFFSYYIGSGTFDIDADATTYLDFGGVGGLQGQFSPVSSSGSVQVRYETTAVPIPSALWLLGSGLIGFLGIRRRAIS